MRLRKTEMTYTSSILLDSLSKVWGELKERNGWESSGRKTHKTMVVLVVSLESGTRLLWVRADGGAAVAVRAKNPSS